MSALHFVWQTTHTSCNCICPYAHEQFIPAEELNKAKPSQQRELGTLGNKFPKRLIEPERRLILTRNFKISTVSTNPKFGKRPRLNTGMTVTKKKWTMKSTEASDIKTKFSYNHIRVVSKERYRQKSIVEKLESLLCRKSSSGFQSKSRVK